MKKILLLAAATLFLASGIGRAVTYYNQALESLYIDGILTVGRQNVAATPVPNPIVNPTMYYDTGAGAPYTIDGNPIATPVLTLDGWNSGMVGSATGLTITKSTGSPPPGFQTYLTATVGTSNATVAAGDYWILYQPIEGLNIRNFGFGTTIPEPFCLSWWGRSSVASLTVGGNINNSSGTRGFGFQWTTDPTASTWDRYAVCAAGDTTGTWTSNDTTARMLVRFAFTAGSNFTTGTTANVEIAAVASGQTMLGTGQNGAWTASGGIFGLNSQLSQLTKQTNGSTVDITGVQLEQSTFPTPFHPLPTWLQRNQIQRYAYALSEPAAGVIVGNAFLDSATTAKGSINLPTSMRAAPTCTVTAGSFHVAPAGAAASGTMAAAATNTPNVAGVTFSGITSSTAGFGSPIVGGGGAGVVYCQARM